LIRLLSADDIPFWIYLIPQDFQLFFRGRRSFDNLLGFEEQETTISSSIDLPDHVSDGVS
jgi:hypothetical protein